MVLLLQLNDYGDDSLLKQIKELEKNNDIQKPNQEMPENKHKTFTKEIADMNNYTPVEKKTKKEKIEEYKDEENVIQ